MKKYILIASLLALSLGQIMASDTEETREHHNPLSQIMTTDTEERTNHHNGGDRERDEESLENTPASIHSPLSSILIRAKLEDIRNRSARFDRDFGTSRDAPEHSENERRFPDVGKLFPCFDCSGTNYEFWRTLRWERFNLVDLLIGIPIGIFGVIDGFKIGFILLEITLQNNQSLVTPGQSNPTSDQGIHLFPLTDSQAFTVYWHSIIYLVGFTYFYFRLNYVNHH